MYLIINPEYGFYHMWLRQFTNEKILYQVLELNR